MEVVFLKDKSVSLTPICNKIEESQHLITNSNQLLSLAKRAVEIAIEEGEDAAVSWIRKNEQ